MLFRFFIKLFIVSFFLNFAWEITQMPLYAPVGLGQIADYMLWLKTHWWVGLKDAFMALSLYLLVAVALRNSYWGRHFTGRRLGLAIIMGFSWAAAVEYYHVFIVSSWSYAPAMPLLPVIGVGLTPVLQMMIVPLVSILLVRRELFS